MVSPGLSRLRRVFSNAILAVLALNFLTPPAPSHAEGLQAKGNYFPIGVWLQDPKNAEKYKAIGINTYIALFDKPDVKQLSELEKAGMQVACSQNAASLDPRWNKVVVGWIQGDEPDNAQDKPGGGYGPPITPDVIVDRYKVTKPKDPLNRPIMLNLGQGVAWDEYNGRGTRTRHPEDYAKYAVGADMVSFDIYPACHDNKQIAGKLNYVGNGVKRLVGWVDNKKPVWACIETTHIENPRKMITPDQVRSEVWMAIINGARGITYFAHEMKPKFIEAGLLAYPDIAESVKKTNAEIQSLAEVINDGKPLAGAAASEKDITLISRQLNGDTYFFATEMAAGSINPTFTAPGLKGPAQVEVIGESRTIDAKDGQWTDAFSGYQAHIYHLKGAAK
jgi:hypothetical protein